MQRQKRAVAPSPPAKQFHSSIPDNFLNPQKCFFVFYEILFFQKKEAHLQAPKVAPDLLARFVHPVKVLQTILWGGWPSIPTLAVPRQGGQCSVATCAAADVGIQRRRSP